MALSAVGLSTHIFNNNLKSVILLICYPVLLLFLVWLFGFLMHFDRLGTAAASDAGLSYAVQYSHWVFLGALIWFSVAWLFHSQMIRLASGAAIVTRQDQPEIYNMLENLCISRGMSVPRLQIIDSPALNAFASGLSDKSYAVTLTTGLIKKLDADELEAVIAHELTHIINRDVRLLIIGVIFAGMIGFFAEMAFRSLMYGRRGYRYRSRRDNNSRGAIYFLVVAMIVLAVGYLFAILIRLAISRKREYLADAGAVEMTKNPAAMMRALMKISGRDRIRDLPEDIEQMCIENSSGFMSFFATHPPIQKRIQVIADMTNTPVPVAGSAGPWGART